ncbi:MAG: four helix bundle protein [Desulfobacterales bacterium]|nr:four helix bundle protein [Desulfobacterales bacterium]
MAKFRFQDLIVWQLAIEIGDELFDIAEGSGSASKKEFSHFLNIARRSTFENANILIILKRRNLVKTEQLEKILDDLDKLCRQITNLRKSLKFN